MEFIPIAEWRKRPIPERVTVDGVVCKVGDVVWCTYNGLTRRTITRDSLRNWGRYNCCTYASERLAIQSEMVRLQRLLKKARQDVHREAAAIVRLRRRLSALPCDPVVR